MPRHIDLRKFQGGDYSVLRGRLVRVTRPILSVLGFVAGVVALWAVAAVLSSGSAAAEPAAAASGYGLGKTVAIGGAAAAVPKTDGPKKDISDSPKKKKVTSAPPRAVAVKSSAPAQVAPAAPVVAPVPVARRSRYPLPHRLRPPRP